MPQGELAVSQHCPWVCDYLLMVMGCGRQLREVSGGRWRRALVAEAGTKVHLSRTGSPVVGSPVAMERDTAQLPWE